MLHRAGRRQAGTAMVMDSQMKEQFESAADYRQRAEECRRKTDASQDEWARATFLDASVEWEKLAEKKAKALSSGTTGPRRANFPAINAPVAGRATTMVFELTTRVRGHEFDFLLGVCLRCQMSKRYEDIGRPRCIGRPPEKRERGQLLPMMIRRRLRHALPLLAAPVGRGAHGNLHREGRQRPAARLSLFRG